MTSALEGIVQDVRLALRGFRHSPETAAVMLLSLAIAMGATTAVFSLANAVLWRPLPYKDPSRLVILWTTHALNGAREQNTSLPNLDDWTARSRSFEALATYREMDGPLLRPSQPAAEAAWTGYAHVDGQVFALLGRPAALGRLFTADDVTARRPVAVISDRLWRRSFGAAGDVVGQPLDVAGIRVDIVGVMPADFAFPSTDVDVWIPATLTSRWDASRANRATRFGPVIGRLRPLVTRERAQAEMHEIAAQLQREYPVQNAELGVNVVALHEQVTGASAPVLLATLLGAVAFVLLIACANVANLQLARGVARSHEVALRTALGATRSRIAAQSIVESVLLGGAAGGLGLLLAGWMIRAFAAFGPASLARLQEARIDGTVWLFSFAVSLATGVLVGLAPVLRLVRAGESDALRGAARSVSPAARSFRGLLVAGEFAIAVVLLSGAGLLIRSLLAVGAVDTGFGDPGAITARLRFHNTLPRATRAARYDEALTRLSALPGVRAAGGVSTMFWDADPARFGLRAVEGRPLEAREQWSALTWTAVSGRYFQAAGIPLLRGRFFDDADRRGAPPVVIVNETMARRYWPDGDAIGRRIKGFDPRGTDDEWVTVVGVVRDVRSRGLEREPMAQIFEAQSQTLDETEHVVVSTASPEGLATAMRRTIAELDRTAVLSDIGPLDRVIGEQSSQRRFETYLLAAFAAIALALAGCGIFGVMHDSVAQRTREIGIRLALGARRGQVLAMIVREGVALTTAGVVAGVAGSAILMRAMASVLFGVAPHDPLTFAAVCALLTLLAVAGCLMPAARAAGIDPMVSLRSE